MDKRIFNHVDEKPNLQPQWLLKNSGSILAKFDDESKKNRSNSFDNQHTGFESSRRIPPMMSLLGRSKSSSHLFDAQLPTPSPNVENIMAEKDSFEKEFPSLGNKDNKKLSFPAQNRWSQSESIAGKLVSSPDSKDASTSSLGLSVEELELQKLRSLVPNVPQVNPKIRADLNSPKRNFKQELSRTTVQKKAAKPHFVRKASSESSLPLSSQQQERYARILNNTKKNEMIQKISTDGRSKPLQAIAKVSKKESSWKALDADKTEERLAGTNESKSSEKIGMRLSPERLKEWKQRMSRSLLVQAKNNKEFNSFGEEDEERFLRNLGWVPEEECHIPELTEEEIRSVDLNALKQTRFGAFNFF